MKKEEKGWRAYSVYKYSYNMYHFLKNKFNKRKVHPWWDAKIEKKNSVGVCVGGSMDRYLDVGCKSCLKDCLQQSEINKIL